MIGADGWKQKGLNATGLLSRARGPSSNPRVFWEAGQGGRDAERNENQIDIINNGQVLQVATVFLVSIGGQSEVSRSVQSTTSVIVDL